MENIRNKRRLFFETREHKIVMVKIWLPAVLTLAYGMVMLYLNGKRRVSGTYPFFRVHNHSVTAAVLWIILLAAAATAISAAVWLLSG